MQLHDRTMLTDCLLAKLERCKDALTGLRVGLYKELCVLKDKVYERTSKRALLEMEVSSLLDALLNFVQVCSVRACPKSHRRGVAEGGSNNTHASRWQNQPAMQDTVQMCTVKPLPTTSQDADSRTAVVLGLQSL